ncbi:MULTISPECIES: M15 family metallopeptidase [Turicibacter]|nr:MULTISPECIES: M15 family metallopeptidase [Turicibacter]
MSCFQVLTLQEQYGDCLEQQVPLDPSIITYDELRYLKVLHFGYDGLFHVGELIVNVKVADEVLDIFKQLYLMRYPIEKLRVMSCYGGSDELSMEDNNSSSFNFRHVTDGGKLSNHAYGLAIDLNPKVNPYVKNDLVLPTNGLAYVNRDQHVLGIIKKNDAVYQLFTSHGWTWGGDWTSLKDYQHFEKNY